jgi:hypothetical protein
MPRMPNNKDGHVLNATLLLYDAATWSEEGREELARWLRQQAKQLVTHGGEYAPRYRARRWSVDEMEEVVSINPDGPIKEEVTRKGRFTSNPGPKSSVAEYAPGRKLADRVATVQQGNLASRRLGSGRNTAGSRPSRTKGGPSGGRP